MEGGVDRKEEVLVYVGKDVFVIQREAVIPEMSTPELNLKD